MTISFPCLRNSFLHFYELALCFSDAYKLTGCVAITHTKDNVAQLRYFFLEPELRGLGVGTDLLHKALDFCREKKYSHVFLWTVSAQETARKLYKKAGFEITETSKNDNWGIPVLEEKWELDL